MKNNAEGKKENENENKNIYKWAVIRLRRSVQKRM